MHYMRKRNNGDQLTTQRVRLSIKRKPELVKHLLQNRNITKTNCWEWTRNHVGRNVNGRGYGIQVVDGKPILVHRLIAHIFLDFDINSNLCVCHHCDNPICFNPDHLFIGTIQDNIDDRERKGRNKIPRGSKQGSSKLKEKDVFEIKQMLREGKRQWEIAEMYGVTRTCITWINTRVNWKHITNN